MNLTDKQRQLLQAVRLDPHETWAHIYSHSVINSVFRLGLIDSVEERHLCERKWMITPAGVEALEGE